MSDIYHGRGDERLYDDYLDFINYVFGFNGNSEDFRKLLPKLYGREDKPVESSYITLEDGKLRAAVGAFDHTLSVCGRELRCRGIGNVAVHPYHRSRGFMRKLMTMAVDDMISDGIVLSELGGRRQRYNYFAFEKTGTAYRFTVNSDNIRHCFGADAVRSCPLSLRRVTAEDGELLGMMSGLCASQIYNPRRNEEDFFDIVTSWHCVPYAFMKGDAFVGYAIAGSKAVHEIVLTEGVELPDAVVALYGTLGTAFTLTLPPFRPDYIRSLYRICESYEVVTDKSFCVLNYRAVLDAFASLKLTYTSVPDGALTLLIHGRAGDERLRLTVTRGEVTVESYDGEVELELEHIDAMNLLFSPFCPGRDELSDFARLLLPLPLWLYYADAV